MRLNILYSLILQVSKRLKNKDEKKLRMFLCAALTASMMATAPALVQAAEEKETTETTESNAVRHGIWLDGNMITVWNFSMQISFQ